MAPEATTFAGARRRSAARGGSHTVTAAAASNGRSAGSQTNLSWSRSSQAFRFGKQ